MNSSTNRQELLAAGKRKLQHFQQNKAKQATSTAISTVDSNKTIINSQRHPNADVHPPALYPSNADLFPFLESSSSEPHTPPSEAFTHTDRHTEERRKDHTQNTHDTQIEDNTHNIPRGQEESHSSYTDIPLTTPERHTHASPSLSSPPQRTQYYADESNNLFYFDASKEPVYYDPYSKPQQQQYTQPVHQQLAPPPPPPPPQPQPQALDSMINYQQHNTNNSNVHEIHTASLPSSSSELLTLRQKIRDYESHIATLQSSLLSSDSSPLPTIQALTHELDSLRADNERLQSVTRTLKDTLRTQGIQLTEMMEDNCRLVSEYEDVCEKLTQAEETQQQPTTRIMDNTTEQTHHQQLLYQQQTHKQSVQYDHDQLFSILNDESVALAELLSDGAQLTQAIEARWQTIKQLMQQQLQHTEQQTGAEPHSSGTHNMPAAADDSSTSSGALIVTSGASAAVSGTAGSLSWSELMRHAHHLSLLLERKTNLEQQAEGYMRSIRQRVDPVALLMSASSAAHDHDPASDTRMSSLSSSSSDSPSSSVASQFSVLQSEKQYLQSQLNAHQERAAALIRDKILLAKRIEDAVEEKAMLVDRLRETIQELEREKQVKDQQIQQFLIQQQQQQQQQEQQQQQQQSHHETGHQDSLYRHPTQEQASYAEREHDVAHSSVPLSVSSPLSPWSHSTPIKSRPPSSSSSVSSPSVPPRSRSYPVPTPSRGLLDALWSFFFGSSNDESNNSSRQAATRSSSLTSTHLDDENRAIQV